MSRTWNARLKRLEVGNPVCNVIIVASGLPDNAPPPMIGETFAAYQERLVAQALETGERFVVVSGWYGAENRAYDGDWFGDGLGKSSPFASPDHSCA